MIEIEKLIVTIMEVVAVVVFVVMAGAVMMVVTVGVTIDECMFILIRFADLYVFLKYFLFNIFYNFYQE